MYKIMTRTAAILALGVGVAVTTAQVSVAQTAAPDQATTTQGAATLDRARGGGVRIGGHRGGGVRFHGGGHRYGGGRHYRGGRYIVPGIAAGIIGSAAVGSYYYGQRSISCGELEYRCDRGEGWACRRLDDDPRC